MKESKKITDVADHSERLVVPAALAAAASVYADRPQKLGEILIVLVEPTRLARLDDGQRVVYEMCRRELAAISERRSVRRERERLNKAAYRKRKDLENGKENK